jgi:hypothetical protein
MQIALVPFSRASEMIPEIVSVVYVEVSRAGIAAGNLGDRVSLIEGEGGLDDRRCWEVTTVLPCVRVDPFAASPPTEGFQRRRKH